MLSYSWCQVCFLSRQTLLWGRVFWLLGFWILPKHNLILIHHCSEYQLQRTFPQHWTALSCQVTKSLFYQWKYDGLKLKALKSLQLIHVKIFMGANHTTSAFNSTLWVRLNLKMYLPIGESRTLWLCYLTCRVWEIVCRHVLQSLITWRVMHTLTIPQSLYGKGKNMALEERRQKEKPD